MKKKIIIPVCALLLIIVALAVPYKKVKHQDGTTEYKAVAYKAVAWKKYNYNYDKYEKTVIYWFADGFKTVDELWQKQSESLPEKKAEGTKVPTAADFSEIGISFTARVKDIDGDTVLVERMTGGMYTFSAGSTIITKNSKRVDVSELMINNLVTITYDGRELKASPGQLTRVYLVEVTQ